MDRDERPPSGGGGGGGSAGFLEPPAALPPPPRNGFCQDELAELDPGTTIREDGMPGGRNKSIGPVQISEEEIERIMSGQEFEEEANHWSNHGDSDHSSPGNRASESNQPSPGSTLSSSRSVELNGFMAFREQYMGMSVPPHYQYIPHLFSYSGHSTLLPPQARSLDPQSYSLIHQLVSAEDLEPLGTPMLIEEGYAVTQAELFALLCRLADELLFRQIAWIKKLPFFCELSIKDYTCLLSSTWQELILLSSLTVYSKQIFGELADVTAKYSPSDEELHRFSDEGMEVIERLIYLYHKFHQLKVSNEEYACMKAINFLNQDIRGLTSASQLEQLNKRYWYICQDFTEYKYTHQPNRFPDLMMCLPEIRYIAGNIPASNPSLFLLACDRKEASSVFRMLIPVSLPTTAHPQKSCVDVGSLCFLCREENLTFPELL
ncbi:nuclear receptor subfamily 6 group A member 1 isoform X7 [Choloepus didactylus]|uniref:nuclear receptor subfamily 6 group A member 1 isoform X7 n=1 Tax=Choloepus didactylus TaxID=27675 RepID=UPI00189FA4BC|nr:nuclear receptor subfamily 6 group A member 1 isoform X7 [Choloepus didactylus]